MSQKVIACLSCAPQYYASKDAHPARTRPLGVSPPHHRLGEFTTAYSAQRLASLLEGVMFRVCLEWSAGFPAEHSLARAIDEGFDLFVRAAEPRPGDKPRKAPSRRKEKA
jgi:hypothetical protein